MAVAVVALYANGSGSSRISGTNGALFAGMGVASGRPPGAQASGDGGSVAESSCVTCHEGIEAMHPEAQLSCVDCHGGNALGASMEEAHVRPGRSRDNERVAKLDEDLAWRRFVNPMDLRVAKRNCGDCHADMVSNVLHSLHGTTAGHLSDGFYEVGATKKRGSRYSVFPVSKPRVDGGQVRQLNQLPSVRASDPEDELATHYPDLARKECMQCHLYSNGRAVRGRVGFDGDYRGEGCAACHVTYATDGFSRSADKRAVRTEPGHARTHSMTRAPATDTCVSCHYGDASIGLQFRGMSQLPPGAPGGPDIPGTTDTLLNRSFYLSDPAMTPPDIHHEKGMHCIDCHTAGDLMGDGRLHGQMEYAVEISCSDCHGDFEQLASLVTRRGTPLTHIRREGEEVILTSKVSGVEHRVPQVLHVLDPQRPEFNPRAKQAMTSAHGQVECYTCHAGWNPNFLGFHFTRNLSLSQLDLVSGKRTPGRVTTQEKVFATWKSFFAGLNEAGRVAPYMTGFSTMGSVYDENGELVLDQVMPVTAEGLSGMSMVHHQMHSVRPTARSCVECHRSASTWGLGSQNFQLGRRLAYVADRRGIESLALNRERLIDSLPLSKFVLPDIVDLELLCDPLQGYGQTLFASEGERGLHAIDVRNPLSLEHLAFQATVQPRGMEVSGEHLYLADGQGGLKVFDVSEPSELEQVAALPMFDAHDVHLSWPWAFVADGAGGLAIVDVRVPISPQLLSVIDVNGPSKVPNDVTAVASLFQYSRPIARDGKTIDERTQARLICAVLDQRLGLALIDVTEPTSPRVLYPSIGTGSRGERARAPAFRGLLLRSHVDLAEAQGGSSTAERDYAYVLEERVLENGERRSILRIFDISDPERVKRVGLSPAGYASEQLVEFAAYNQPFLQRFLLAPGAQGLYMIDASLSAEPSPAGILPSIPAVYAVATERFALDRMQTPEGARLKDISHAESRWLYRSQFERILTVPGSELGLGADSADESQLMAITARRHLREKDRDRDGFLNLEEAEELGPGWDLDEDGRVSLFELGSRSGLLSLPREKAEENPFARTRTDFDGDLARLFDGVNPSEYDLNQDWKLDPSELDRAFFAALDLNRDKRLSMDEASRAPGAMRQVRYGDALAKEIFRGVDRNRDGQLKAAEVSIDEESFAALDADGNGSVQLEVNREVARRLGVDRTAGEWPSRRPVAPAMPPVLSMETLLAVFDDDDDQLIGSEEMKGRAQLFEFLDRDRNRSLDEVELQRAVALMDRQGVNLAPDDYLVRWDLDGDERVGPEELPSWLWRRIAKLGAD